MQRHPAPRPDAAPATESALQARYASVRAASKHVDRIGLDVIFAQCPPSGARHFVSALCGGFSGDGKNHLITRNAIPQQLFLRF